MNFLNKSLSKVLFVLFSLAFLSMLLQPLTNSGFVEPISVIILAISLFFVLRWIYQKLSTLNQKKLKIFAFVLIVFIVLTEILWAMNGHAELFGDPWHIQVQAERLFKGQTSWDIWILQYPNLVPLVGLELAFMKTASFLHISFYGVFYTYNIIISSLIWILVARLLWQKKPFLSVFSLLIIFCSPVLSGFLVQVGYSDGLAILSLLIIVSIFDKAVQKGRFTFLEFLASLIIFAVAYLARPNVIVSLVAILIIGILAYWKKEKYLNIWKICLYMAIAFILGIIFATLANHLIAKSIGYNLNNPHVFPIWNWVYESLNLKSGGEWGPTDRDYTLFHIGYSSSKAADIAGIIQRLKTYNLLLIPLFFIKFATLWSEGTFEVGSDYTLFNYRYNWTHAPAFITENIGSINIFWEIVLKALMALLLFSIAYSLLKKKKDLTSSYGFMLLIIMGVSIFHTFIWEVKPRYQFMTIGLLLIVGLLNLDSIFGDEKISIFKQDFNWKKFIKIFVPVASVLSLLSMSTIMQLQPKQKIVVTAQQHPADNYGYSKDVLKVSPKETIYQEFELSTNANQIEWQTGTTGPLTLKIQKNSSENWSDFDSHTIKTENTTADQVNQIFNSNMSAGQYRLAIYNPNSVTVGIRAMLNPIALDYPYLIKLPNGQTASLGFVISQSKEVSKYPFVMISFFAILFLVINIFIHKW
ncbi:MAG TPA: hypothetical protein VGC17_00720 [Lactovum miscens]|uniref:hypothetical protein n=1 Tax=Lactovum miscens TaxID=190387 RepID=UPI002ED99F0D